MAGQEEGATSTVSAPTTTSVSHKGTLWVSGHPHSKCGSPRVLARTPAPALVPDGCFSESEKTGRISATGSCLFM